MARPMSRRSKRNKARTNNQPAKSQADVVMQHSQSIETTTTWTGPIPPPDALERYEATLPGAADRILNMAERQIEHRIQLEKKAVGGDSIRSYLGIASALIISLAIVAASIYLISKGYSWEGVSLIGIDLVGLVFVFIYGTRVRRAEREHKAEMMSQMRPR